MEKVVVVARVGATVVVVVVSQSGFLVLIKTVVECVFRSRMKRGSSVVVAYLSRDASLPSVVVYLDWSRLPPSSRS